MRKWMSEPVRDATFGSRKLALFPSIQRLGNLSGHLIPERMNAFGSLVVTS